MRNIIIRLISLASLLILFMGGVEARPQEFTFAVEHKHLFKSCKGELTINIEGVQYTTSDKEHARKWAYTDIQMIKLVSPKEFQVLTYESKRMRLGGDEIFKFKILEGEVTREVSEFLLARVERPLATGFVATEDKGQYEIPVRHRHRLSSCQGTIKIYADRVTYESSEPENSRYWRWSDIQSISRTGLYQFSITTYEPKVGGPTKTFNFDLKEAMGDSVYDFLWARVYKISYPTSFEVKR